MKSFPRRKEIQKRRGKRRFINVHGVAKYTRTKSDVSILRWFPSFALRIPTAHDFCVISDVRARAQNVRDSPQTKLDSEVNARFLLNEHGDPHIFFYKFNENNVLNNWEKNWQKSMATFLANEINVQIET